MSPLRDHFQQAGKRVSVTDMVAEFQRIYALPSEADGIAADLHDSLHAYTGFGITGADELRVDVYATALTASGCELYEDIVDKAVRNMNRLHKQLQEQARNPDKNIFDVEHTRLNSADFLAAQDGLEALSRREVGRHVHQAMELSRAIRKVAGRGILDLTSEDLAGLDFSRLDISGQTTQIKCDLQSTRNGEIEAAALGVLHAAAAKEGRAHDIPAPNTPWHGAAKRSFRL